MNAPSRKKIFQIVNTAQDKGKKPDFSGTNLSQTNLSGAYLSGAFFIEANLTQANLNQVNLAGANLSGANLSGAHLRGANLAEAYLSKAKLGQANLKGTYLRKAHLSGADLSGADLSGANLSGADLSGADLSGANLSRADLSQADLIWANLSRADLSEANLRQADLSEADLSQAHLGGAGLSETNLFRANLSEVDLRQAHLIWADLSDVDLSRANLSLTRFNRVKFGQADLSKAIIGLTTFEDVDLNMVKGLDSVQHLGPSTVGIDTLSRSKGQISEAFLRGCGLSDVQIETNKLNKSDLTFDHITNITSKIHELLVEQAVHSCFISYASKDELFVQQLHDDLQQMGVRCWFAPEALKIGNGKATSTIDHSIRLYDKLVLVLSERSINSNWVEREVETVFMEEDRRSETVLFPIQLDETVLATSQAWATNIRHTRRIGNFSQWRDHEVYQQSFTRLLQDLAIIEEEQFLG